MNKPTWSRREFLETSAAAAGVAFAAKPLQFRPVAPSDTVRFGMVGIGMQGSGLLGTSVSLPTSMHRGCVSRYSTCLARRSGAM